MARKYKKPNSRKRKEARRARIRKIKTLRKIVKLRQLTINNIIKFYTIPIEDFPIYTLTKHITK